MSLILDALRKLEREKQSPDPDVVVVGPVAWGGSERRWQGRALGVLAAFAVLGAAVVIWRLFLSPPLPTPPAGASGTPGIGSPTGNKETPATRNPASGPEAPTSERTAPEAAARAPLAAPQPRALDLPPAPAAPQPPRGSDTSGPAAPTAHAPLQLTAISVRDGRPVALLNDHLVREGDSFDGVKVIRIGETEVEVEIDGKRRVVGF